MKYTFYPKPINFFIFNILFTCCLFVNSFSQTNQFQPSPIDVLDYKFEIALSDSSDVIYVNATVKIAFKNSLESFILDLKSIEDDKGMNVDKVTENKNKVKYKHQNDKIEIFAQGTKKDSSRIFHIQYHGIPDDGLIISNNKFGDRVFFGDCWPNRAHHWLCCVDHPSDKATVEFIVKAPSYYQVVANGFKVKETMIGNETFTDWKSNEPLPTKLMVIGVARFAVLDYTDSLNIPISTWVFPQNRDLGFKNYCCANKPLDYFISKIGTYPFSKLANVQSKTIYGGMENAGCIFYYENSVINKQEDLFAHEIAHQWFGDAVSELNWYHIWLSEGFATYLADLYMENQHGKDVFISRMMNERREALDFAKQKLTPVIDTTITNLMELLNANSYQKCGWVLYMLHKDLGDKLFWESLSAFFQKYKYGNALTSDFESVVELVSGKDFHTFFNQWLYQSGHPVISSAYTYKNNEIKFTVKQHQKQFIFKFPLEIKIVYENGTSSFETLAVNDSENIFTFKSRIKPKEIILDPNTCLFFETTKIVD